MELTHCGAFLYPELRKLALFHTTKDPTMRLTRKSTIIFCQGIRVECGFENLTWNLFHFLLFIWCHHCQIDTVQDSGTKPCEHFLWKKWTFMLFNGCIYTYKYSVFLYFCRKNNQTFWVLIICSSFSIWDTVVDGQEAENCYRHLLKRNETTWFSVLFGQMLL